MKPFTMAILFAISLVACASFVPTMPPDAKAPNLAAPTPKLAGTAEVTATRPPCREVAALPTAINRDQMTTEILERGFIEEDLATTYAEACEELRKSLAELQLVDVEQLDREYKDYGTRFRYDLIASLQSTYDGSSDAPVLMDRWAARWEQNPAAHSIVLPKHP